MKALLAVTVVVAGIGAGSMISGRASADLEVYLRARVGDEGSRSGFHTMNGEGTEEAKSSPLVRIAPQEISEVAVQPIPAWVEPGAEEALPSREMYRVHVRLTPAAQAALRRAFAPYCGAGDDVLVAVSGMVVDHIVLRGCPVEELYVTFVDRGSADAFAALLTGAGRVARATPPMEGSAVSPPPTGVAGSLPQSEPISCEHGIAFHLGWDRKLTETPLVARDWRGRLVDLEPAPLFVLTRDMVIRTWVHHLSVAVSGGAQLAPDSPDDLWSTSVQLSVAADEVLKPVLTAHRAGVVVAVCGRRALDVVPPGGGESGILTIGVFVCKDDAEAVARAVTPVANGR